MKNKKENLTAAKAAKNDEFYTQYTDIEKEMNAYLEYDADVFRDKVVYCNCDDPFESNFFRYFVLNFEKLSLKQLITTSYKPSPIANTQLELIGSDKSSEKSKCRPKATANKFIINKVHIIDGGFNLKDVAIQLRENKHNEWTSLEGDGDFRSDECIKILKQADIVVSNPPFSLFREYVKQLADHEKKFVIIGNTNAITYKELFPLIQNNKLWLGCTNFNVGMYFEVPDDRDRFHRIDEVTGKKLVRVSTSCWYTNLDHGRRHAPLSLMTRADILRFSRGMKGKTDYSSYDNYDAIEVGTYKDIPSDYDGVMGVPITFLNKYCPEQFSILGLSRYTKTEGMSKEFVDAYYESGQTGAICEGHPDLCYYDHNNRPVVPYMRILIEKKRGAKK